MALKSFGVLFFFLFIIASAQAQNTKGDKPVSNRESRFKTPFKKTQKKKEPSGKRVKSKGKSFANSGQRNPPGQKARSASGKIQNVYPQNGPYVHNPSRKPREIQRPVSNRSAQARLKRLQGPAGARAAKRNVYPQYGSYVHNPSRKPNKVQRPVSNRAALTRLKRLQGPEPSKPGKKQVVVPRTASGSFIARKSPNTWAQFPRPKRKSEVAVTKDIAGRKLRTKNYETPRPGVIAPTFHPYAGRKRVSDRPYKGPAAGGHISATRPGQRAWRGDITGRTIRGRNYYSKGKQVEGQPTLGPRRKKPARGDKVYRGTIPGSGYKSVSKSGEKRPGNQPLPVRTPAGTAARAGNFSGNIKVKPALIRNQGEGYAGNIKGRKRAQKGGGSVSGKLWNNGGSSVPVRTPSRNNLSAGQYSGNVKLQGQVYRDQGEAFTGYGKTRRLKKGGGSVSGKLWNNRESAIPVRTPSKNNLNAGQFSGNVKLQGQVYHDQGEEFTGYSKARKPKTGGGSVSGKLWNNNESAIPVKGPSRNNLNAGQYSGNLKFPGHIYRDQGEEFTGYTKASKPKKGGGSISGKLWNNNETPIAVRTPPAEAARAGEYSGNIKTSQQHILRDQGEEFTGVIRLKRFKKDYIRNPNASEEALKKKAPDKSTYKVDDFQVRVKRSRYVENPNSADDALLKLKPGKSVQQVDELQVKVRVKAGYIHNPSSAKEALRVHEPGKAFARATDYQGNIKMKKYDLFGKPNLHPDAQFVKINKNNVAEEKDLITNFKLWWARLFRKNETLPDHLKDKGHKPRYDKDEEGLWYE